MKIKKMVHLTNSQKQSLDNHGNTIMSFTQFKKNLLDKYFYFDPDDEKYLKDKKAYILPDKIHSKAQRLSKEQAIIKLGRIDGICQGIETFGGLYFDYPKKIKMKFVYDHEFYYDSYFVLSVRKD